MRWIKRGIGCLGMLLLLGTLLFSAQVFTGTYPVAPSYNRTFADEVSNRDTGVSDADLLEVGGFVPSSADAAEHSMNRKHAAGGFLAAPWIPVSYIHKSSRESSLFQQEQKYLRPYIVIAYPANRKNGVTDHAIQSMSNPDSRIQAFAYHVAKLTAG